MTNGINNISGMRGFTLLEMVLVLFLLGVLASISMVFVENNDNQQRYDASVQKLYQIYKSVIRITYDGEQPLLSGYVADNGKLPEISSPYPLWPLHRAVDGTTVQQPYGEKEPYYRYAEATVYKSVKVAVAGGNSKELTMFKGFRRPLSLVTLLDSTPELRDAWGGYFTVTDPAGAIEYQISLQPASTITPTFPDRSADIYPDDWSIGVNQINITLNNKGSSIITNTNGYFIALFVYKNTTSGGQSEWPVTYRSADQKPIAVGPKSNILMTHKVTDSAEITIPAGERIPFGTYLLVLIDNDKVIGVTPTDGNVVYDATGKNIYLKFNIFPGMSPPSLVLEID
ncbi:MAG: prepilin-type N-terminal cleavage/methylation domain-containing protein [Nitrospira sp.]|nr:prepilin-type N-terminal cleavage/methylation domain-containing protein [bacterium]MBL7048319.1 prepilin-type N-terminal cleavage/methylation domain-containing protein [Nitrospira sp.]